MPLPVGKNIGRYEVLSQIGAGGMGEVYLARDTELERTVALKVLPEDVALDKRRMERFIREAKTTSALNHPNILTIFEIGHTDSKHFIVTEYIEGHTLRQYMSDKRLKLTEALNISIQTADALSAAHAASIIHRDIKPENMMIRSRDGYVKVLDFGIAKLVEQQSIKVDREAATKALFKTEEGLILGTLIYMSPEQARGEGVDARTDIWSLGVVTYEMVAGCLPFEGGTKSEILASILNEREPPPLARFTREVPAELERIVEKALRKDREERYQTAKDMLLDLRRLKHKLEVDAEIERTVLPELRGAADETIAPGGEAVPIKSAPTTSSAAYIITEINRHKRGVVIALAAIILLAIASIAYHFYFAEGTSRAAIDSIAVLPFVNTSNDPNTEYLSDGISDALINSLTELQQLRVIARSTAFRYKGKEVDPRAVGRELNVQAVLMGRVRQTGETLNIQVDLVDATTGAQIWGHEYERKVLDTLSVKQAIAREVTENLRLRMSGQEGQRLAKRETTNPEAYEFYLKGRYFYNKKTAEGLQKAIDEFQQAIKRDPNYALGYVGLADCYVVLGSYTDLRSGETLPKARAAADRALQIDDSLAEAHESSAYIYLSLWRWAEAEEEYKRAISLNPNYAFTHYWYSQYFRVRRQFDDALREIKRAQELEPLSPSIGDNVGVVYLLKNDSNSAIAEFQKVIQLYPDFSDAHDRLGLAYLKQGRYEEALTEVKKAVELSEGGSDSLSDLAYCYAVTGRRAEAHMVIKELEERYARGKTTARYIAGVYAGLGNKDEVFAWLEKDFQQRSGDLPRITWWFYFDDVRSDPRYADLVRRMGLTP
jgi:serine/threonine protein kinase/Tfp pilus assembly protein PilF